MTATVTKRHTTPSLATLDQDALMAIVQRDAAMRAVYRVIDILKAGLARAKSEWKDKRTKATQAYREHLRDEDREALRGSVDRLGAGGRLSDRDRQNLASIAEHYYAACEGLAEHDDVLADGKADKDARAKQIAKFEAAHRELAMQGRDGGSAQVALFEPEAKGAAALAMTDETKEHVYAALLQLDKDGGLDDVQKLLLAELGEAGIKALDLGINAAAAVEQAVADEPDDDDEDEDGEGSEIPF